VREQHWPRAWKTTTPGAVCPQCGAAAGRPIVWGDPIAAVLASLEAGDIDVELGGCVIPDEPVSHHCRACSATFTPPRRRS
jgi:hypothetical protein